MRLNLHLNWEFLKYLKKKMFRFPLLLDGDYDNHIITGPRIFRPSNGKFQKIPHTGLKYHFCFFFRENDSMAPKPTFDDLKDKFNEKHAKIEVTSDALKIVPNSVMF